ASNPSFIGSLFCRLSCRFNQSLCSRLGRSTVRSASPILPRYNEAKEQVMPSKMKLLTIGHSNHPLDRFLDLLARPGIEALVDIRRFPGSRRHPHFHRDSLAAALSMSGIEYHWLEALGGRRHKQREESPNLGLENQGFRNYADYLLTDEFREGVEKLLEA